MRKALLFICFSVNAMELPESTIIQLNLLSDTQEEEHYCDLAMQSYNRVTSGNCSPSIRPYLLRIVSHSRHNGDSERFSQMKQEIKSEDEAFLVKLVDSAMNIALKDKEAEIEKRILKRDAAMYVGLGSLACSIITTGITLAATLSGKCP